MKGNICLYLMMYLILTRFINVKNCIQKLVPFYFDKYFSIVNISLNLRFLVAIDDIYIERIMSQNFVCCLSFCFMSKNGQLFIYFVEYFLLDFIENEPGPIYKI